MLADLLPVIVVAGIAIAVVYLLFNSVSSVSTKKVEASKVLQQAAAQPKKVLQKVLPKELSKKEKAAAKAREAELDALVAKEMSAPARGLAAEKYEVETLDQAKAKAKAKKETSKKATGQAVAAAEAKVISEEQKAKDRSQGFKIVEAKEERKESSPTTAAATVKGARHSGTKKASPTSPAQQQRDDLEKKLSQFFKTGNRRGNNRNDDYTPATADKAPKTRLSPQSGVTLKSDIAPASGNAWGGEKEWV